MCIRDSKKETQRTANRKRSVGVWAGEGLEPVQLKRKADNPPTQASAPPRGSSHSSPEIPGECLLNVVEEVKPGEFGYDLKTPRELGMARGFQVPSLQDLATGKSEAAKLLPWMHAIAYGLPLQETKHPCGRAEHSPSSERIPSTIHCEYSFRKSQTRIMTCMEAICRQPNSKWNLVSTPNMRNCKVIKTENDLRKFLLSVRRLQGTRLTDKYPRTG